METINFEQLKQTYLPLRDRNSHKGDFGHVGIVGGDYGMGGATRMAGEAALRVGAGLVTLITRDKHLPIINALRPELMSAACENETAFVSSSKRATILAIGPGLGRQSWGQMIFKVSAQDNRPKVIDADALWFLSKSDMNSNSWILTPHPGEAATLLGTNTEDVQNNRREAIKSLQKQYGGVMVLKGAGTLIYDGKSEIKKCQSGNPGMTTGGMGDILTGIIAGLLAQKIPLYEAACLGVELHARAGDLSAQKKGQRGMLATDILDELRELIN